MESVMVSEDYVRWARSTSKLFAHYYNPKHGEQSREDYEKFNFVGIVGELAASVTLLGSEYPVVQSRTDGLVSALEVGRPNVKEDLHGYTIDVKSALIGRGRSSSDYHLYVMPGCYSPDMVYVFVGVHTPKRSWDLSRPWKCDVVGWARGSSLFPPTSNLFCDSYWCPASKLSSLSSLDISQISSSSILRDVA